MRESLVKVQKTHCVHVERLEKELDDLYTEMHKLYPHIKVIYDREVWNKVRAWGRERYGR